MSSQHTMDHLMYEISQLLHEADDPAMLKAHTERTSRVRQLTKLCAPQSRSCRKILKIIHSITCLPAYKVAKRHCSLLSIFVLGLLASRVALLISTSIPKACFVQLVCQCRCMSSIMHLQHFRGSQGAIRFLKHMSGPLRTTKSQHPQALPAAQLVCLPSHCPHEFH